MESISHLLTLPYLIGTVLLVVAISIILFLKSWSDDSKKEKYKSITHLINSFITITVVAVLIWMFVLGFTLLLN